MQLGWMTLALIQVYVAFGFALGEGDGTGDVEGDGVGEVEGVGDGDGEADGAGPGTLSGAPSRIQVAIAEISLAESFSPPRGIAPVLTWMKSLLSWGEPGTTTPEYIVLA